MLAARGKGLLSWIEDDSLIVDETATAIPEAVWALGNVAGDSPSCRDLVLSHGGIGRCETHHLPKKTLAPLCSHYSRRRRTTAARHRVDAILSAASGIRPSRSAHVGPQPRRVQPIKPSRTRATPAPSQAAPTTEPSRACTRADPCSSSQSAEPIPTFWSHTNFGRSPRSLGPAAWKAHLFLLLGLDNQISRVPVSLTCWSRTCMDMTRVTRRDPRIPIVLGVPRGTEDQSYVPTGSHVARVRERARDWVEDEARAKASWRATRSDRGEP
ncbi:importin subunit alpha-like [Cucumis melo var. makuwa]|uniref:Importin subunit alpha-like n=1 Tax=Cucumis melo var. makuwa TaxID=1194695 RepID=A0A5A7T396_CUCMM|nr:importin subunit alpha-like [Cucumis melo var. makuwa]